jgi:hypothetical protein
MSSNQPPERICLKQVERDGHLQWVEASGVNGEPEYQLISRPAPTDPKPDNLYDAAIMLLRSWAACFGSPPSDWQALAQHLVADTHALLRDEQTRQAAAFAPTAPAAASWEDDPAFMVWLRANVEDWKLEFSGHLEGMWAAFKAGQEQP